MFSLFCVVVCVLAQLINSAVHPAAILLRKIRVVGFIDGDLPFVPNRWNVCNPALRSLQELIALYLFLRSRLESLAVASHPLKPDCLFRVPQIRKFGVGRWTLSVERLLLRTISQFILLPSYFPKYFICLVPALRVSSGRSSINSSAGTV